VTRYLKKKPSKINYRGIKRNASPCKPSSKRFKDEDDDEEVLVKTTRNHRKARVYMDESTS